VRFPVPLAIVEFQQAHDRPAPQATQGQLEAVADLEGSAIKEAIGRAERLEVLTEILLGQVRTGLSELREAQRVVRAAAGRQALE